MEGLSALANLRVLDVSNNKLTSVDDIKSLTKYVTFRASGLFFFLSFGDFFVYILTLP